MSQVVVWVSGLITLIFTVIGFVAGCVVTHAQLRQVNRQRYKEGHDTGERVGWYSAADEIWTRAVKMRQEFVHSNTSIEYVNGYEDASKHLNHYWDHVDRLI